MSNSPLAHLDSALDAVLVPKLEPHANARSLLAGVLVPLRVALKVDVVRITPIGPAGIIDVHAGRRRLGRRLAVVWGHIGGLAAGLGIRHERSAIE